MSDENFFSIPVDAFKDERFQEAVREYPPESWVFITTTRQIGQVEEVRATADGPRIKIRHIGSVPVADLRKATDEEIQQRLHKTPSS